MIVGAWVLATGATAAAAEEEPPTDGATLLRSETVERAPELRPWRGLEPRFGRELTWARWMMAGDPSSSTEADGGVHPAAPWLNLAQFRGEAALFRPDAGETALSAIGSMAIAGLPVLGVWRGGRITQRHFLRGYFRGRGVAIAWRIEF